MKKLPNTDPKNNRAKARRMMGMWTLVVAMACLLPTRAFAASTDPLTIVNNLSTFIFSCIRAIGIIILGWGIVQVGMSVQSHDASQRTQGFLCLFGGLLITFAKEMTRVLTCPRPAITAFGCTALSVSP